MNYLHSILLLMVLHQSSARLQQAKAVASGECAVAHQGNGDVITISNCGIGREQGKKIESLLREIIAGQKSDDIDSKLDQLLLIASRPNVTTVQAPVSMTGGDCTQNVVGGSNNVNNCTPKPFQVTASQGAQIAKSLRQYLGPTQPVTVAYTYDVPGGQEAAEALVEAIQDAGIITKIDAAQLYISCGGPRQIPGLSLLCVSSDDDPFVQAIERALLEANVIRSPISKVGRTITGPNLTIMIRKP